MQEFNTNSILFSGPELVGKAFDKIFSTLGFGHVICLEATSSQNSILKKNIHCALPAPTGIRVGLILASDETEFFKHFAVVSHNGADFVLTIQPHGLPSPPWETCLEPLIREAFESCCAVSSLNLEEIITFLKGLEERRTSSISLPWKCIKTAEATNVLPALIDFSHGQDSDISNSILAPLRILLLENKEVLIQNSRKAWWNRARVAWKIFTREVGGKLEDKGHLFGYLGSDIRKCLISTDEVVQKIDKRISLNSMEKNESIQNIYSLMHLLSEVKAESALTPQNPKSHSSPDLNVEPISIESKYRKSDSGVKKILVVDDYAWSWRPVLEVVAKMYCDKAKHENSSLLIEFSSDAKTVSTKLGKKGPENLYPHIPSYDLILLDVFFLRCREERG